MKVSIKSILLGCIALCCGELVAQTDSTCVNKVLELESAMYIKTLETGNKAAHLTYRVSSTDWEGKKVESGVQLYRNEGNLHLFSDQADLFVDASEMFVVLKIQKAIMANATPKNVIKNGYNDEFIKLRNSFLHYCELEYCQVVDSVNGIKEVKLRVQEDLEGFVSIETMTYGYNEKSNKVLSSKVTYHNTYKIKKMVITYVKFEKSVAYNFRKSKQYVLDNHGKLLKKYAGFELIDDRY